MSDQTLSIKQSKSPASTPPVVTKNPNPLGLDLGEFRLTEDECKRGSTSGSLVQGLDFYLFPQCSDEMNSPILSIECGFQTSDGVTWDLKAETGEISTNCPNSTRSYLKKETMTLEVSLSGAALADGPTMDFLQGRRKGPNGNVRSYGQGAIRKYIAVLVDRESMTAAVYPDVQYVMDSIQVKKTFDSEPTSKIMLTVNKADIGDGDPFFYEVRSIAPNAPIPAL